MGIYQLGICYTDIPIGTCYTIDMNGNMLGTIGNITNI
jgi:hypothetical protein